MFIQTDSRWKDITFSPAKLKIGSFGCFICSLAWIVGKEPPETASILESNGCFDNNGMLSSICAKNALGLEYGGKTTIPSDNCIAETNYYAPKNPQHFFVLENGKQLDPLGKNIKYPIVSYRLFSKVNKEEKKEEVKMNNNSNELNPYDDKGWLEAHKNGVRDLYRKWLDREPENDQVVDGWTRRSEDIGTIENEFVKVAIGEWKERLKECNNKPPIVKEIPVEKIVEKPVDVIVEKTIYKDRNIEVEHSWSEYIALGLRKLLKLNKDI